MASHAKTVVTCSGDITDQAACNSFWEDAVESGYISRDIPAVAVEIKKFETLDDGHVVKQAAFRVEAPNIDPAWGYGLFLTLEIGEHDEEQYDDEGNVKVDYKGDTLYNHVPGDPMTSFVLTGIGSALDEDEMKGFPRAIKDWLPTVQKYDLQIIHLSN